MIIQSYKCTIPDFPTEVQVSKKKRPTYWTRKDDAKGRIPQKYSDRTKYDFNLLDRLVDVTTMEPVIKNSKTAGLPRMLSINAQKIYVGLHHSVRSVIVNQLHEMFHKEFSKQLPATINLGKNRLLISLNFHDVYTSKLPDLDNLANLFVKCGIDCLTSTTDPVKYPHKLGIIQDDKIKYIPHILCEFTHITDPALRKLDFNIFVVPSGFSVETLLMAKSAKDLL